MTQKLLCLVAHELSIIKLTRSCRNSNILQSMADIAPNAAQSLSPKFTQSLVSRVKRCSLSQLFAMLLQLTVMLTEHWCTGKACPARIQLFKLRNRTATFLYTLHTEQVRHANANRPTHPGSCDAAFALARPEGCVWAARAGVSGNSLSTETAVRIWAARGECGKDVRTPAALTALLCHR